MATGARWRELAVPDVERYRGAGLYHAAMPADAERFRDEDVLVVGGGNSAGQAATHLARHARSVRVAVRGDGLSTHDVALPGRPRRALAPHRGADRHGGRRAARPRLARRRHPPHATTASSGCRCAAVFVMIGAEPCTEAVDRRAGRRRRRLPAVRPGAAACDGRLSWPLADRAPHLLETVRPGRLRRRRRPRGGDQPRRGRGGRRRPGDPVRARRPGRLTAGGRPAGRCPWASGGCTVSPSDPEG